MDNTRFIKSLQSLSNEQLTQVKGNIIQQLRIVESLVLARLNDNEAPAQSTSHPEQNVRGEWTRAQIDAKLRGSDEAVETAIIRLFELQTASEQNSAGTHCQNAEGFDSGNAKAGTRFARWLLGMNDRNEVKYPKKSLNHPRANRIFSRYCQDGGTVMDRARKIALRHSSQLVTIANAK